EDPVGQVLAQRVLLVLLVARAMRAQLQRPHAFEYRPLHFLPGELDSERDEGAVARHEAKVAAGAQLDGNGAALAIAAVDPHHGRKASRARRVAFFVDRLEVGGERQAERIGALEEVTVLRGPAPLACLFGIGPRRGEPGQRVLLMLLLLRGFLGARDVGGDQQQDKKRRDESRRRESHRTCAFCADSWFATIAIRLTARTARILSGVPHHFAAASVMDADEVHRAALLIPVAAEFATECRRARLGRPGTKATVVRN